MQRDKAAADEEHASGKAVIEAVHLAGLGFGNDGFDAVAEITAKPVRTVEDDALVYLLEYRQQVGGRCDEVRIGLAFCMAFAVSDRAESHGNVPAAVFGAVMVANGSNLPFAMLAARNVPRSRCVAHDIIRQMSSTIAAMKQADMPSLSMSSRVGMVMTLPFP